MKRYTAVILAPIYRDKCVNEIILCIKPQKIISNLLIVALQIALFACTAWTAVSPHFSNGYTCITCHYTNLFLGIKGVDCLTCHKPGDPYGRKKAFTQADFADPFRTYTSLYAPSQYQSSHSWIANYTVPKAGALPPENPAMTWDCDASAATNEVYCTRCHNVHQPLQPEEELAKMEPLLRMANNQDQMCLDCHRQRNTVDHAKGSHPVGVSYGGAGSLVARKPAEFRNPPVNSNPSNPTSAMQLKGGMVLCTTCHGVHNTDSNSATFDSFTSILAKSDGYLLRSDLKGATAESLNICSNCHVKPNHNKKGQNIQCADCHAGHVDTADGSIPNVYLIRRFMNISTQYGKTTNSPAFYQYTASRRNWNSSDPARPGVCQACHPVPLEGYPADHAVKDNATVCMKCHSHAATFSHGAGGSGGCEGCHGHSAGYEYSPGSISQGVGTWRSHATHTQPDGGNAKGPNIACNSCHDTNAFPYFKSGTDANNDGRYNLSETDVCNLCHSPGGTYDGVNNAIYGAKDNWKSGIYSENVLISGKEKWCASCHDESPSVISGVAAPNIAGNESGTYAYGSGWGYYKTGHGLSPGKSYPSSNDHVSGAGVECSDCHNLSKSHIDGTARTYVYTAAIGADNDYQNGYRLKGVDGGLPMTLPRNNGCSGGVSANDFRLCMGCHDSEAFVNSCSSNTNFRNSGTGINAHYYHLEIKNLCGPGPKFASDWKSHGYDSQVSCVTCHNVHGSTQLAMVRDGKLINREPGLQVSYNGPGVSYVCGGPSPYPPTPANVTLDNSTGTVWNANVGNVCGGCHGSCGFNASYSRTPFDGTPPRIDKVYGVVGGNVLTVLFSELVYSNPGEVGALVPADFVFSDADNGRSIVGVTHVAGDHFATVTLSSPLDSNSDIGVNSFAAAPGSIFDGYDIAMGATPVTVTADTAGPLFSDQSPANGSVSISVTSDISLTLTDSNSGVDWSTFSIRLSGNKGYSKTYTALNTAVVSRTGTPFGYGVTVNPDVNFNNGELITVTVNAKDLVGNPLTPPAWSFTTLAVSIPETKTLHPSGSAFAGGFTATGGGWDTVLDSNDGLTSRAAKCGGCGYPCDANSRFIVDMENSGLTVGTIQGIEIGVVAKYAPSCPTSGTTTGSMEICYSTGTNTVCTERTVSGELSTYTANFTTDSNGGTLDISDIDNIQIEIRRKSAGSIHLIVSEVYVKATYVP